MKVDVVLDMASLQAQQESQQNMLREETTKELAGPFEFLHEQYHNTPITGMDLCLRK